MASDSREDSGTDDILADEYDDADDAPLAGGTRKLVVEQDRMRPTSHSQDSVKATNLVPSQYQHSSSYEGELEAKNKTITALQQKLKHYQERMSGGSLRDSGDAQLSSPTSPTVPTQPVFAPRHGNTGLQHSASSISFDAETSNSTDAEKLASADRIRELVKETDSLQMNLSKVTEENEKLKEKLSEQQRLHKQTCDLKEDLEKMYSELQKKYYEVAQELEHAHTEVGLLKQQLEDDNHKRLEFENEKYRKYELKSKEQLHKVQRELEAVRREKSELQSRLDEQLSEALSATGCK